MARPVLALDIGGANLKAAHSAGQTGSEPFELWRNPDGLAPALEALLRRFPPADLLAITMTGELCDCFESKRQGVAFILDAVARVAGNLPVRVWTTAGELVAPEQARAEPLRVAAANWLALASFAGRYVPSGPAVVVDVGSTTTDIVPLRDGKPIPQGRTDPERLRCQELVYTGVRRTPVCALLGGGGAAEWFATTLDVNLVLGWIPEEADNRATADGRPATRPAAHARLARMRCADAETCGPEETTRLARQLLDQQARMIRSALLRVSLDSCRDPFPTAVLAGSGEFLARLALGLHPPFPVDRVISLADEFGPAASGAACAFALAQLAVEREGG